MPGMRCTEIADIDGGVDIEFYQQVIVAATE
jgi:hypothetical protein